MHIPKTFEQNNIDELVSIIQQYPFATLICSHAKGIDATHLPFIIEKNGEDLVLLAHIAKANPLWKAVHAGSDVLVVFNGPNCYVSPNHYPTKQQNGKAVPTWNYVVVHVKGSISFSNDPDWKYKVIDELTTVHEANSEIPWSISDAPDSFINNMLLAIVGVQITVNSIVGQWKLSQNQPRVNQQGVISGLSAMDNMASQSVADMARKQATPK